MSGVIVQRHWVKWIGRRISTASGGIDNLCRGHLGGRNQKREVVLKINQT